MKRVVVTGVAGFIGRWVAKRFLDEGWHVVGMDDLSSGSTSNLEEFAHEQAFDFVEGDTSRENALATLFAHAPDLCIHLAAQINVQRSIDDPIGTFEPDLASTLRIAEHCRLAGSPLFFMSSCMVYAQANGTPIEESHDVLAASPYAASKLAGEHLVLSYGRAYGLPVVVGRPFNTYGPFQRADGEGGVVAIFCKRAQEGIPIDVYGTGEQTRDLLYVEDCAEFVFRAASAQSAHGEIVNAGTGDDITVNALAELIGGGGVPIRHVEHPHPQAEIARLVCDASKARRLIGWEPQTALDTGIEKTKKWLGGG